ncbi:hypothetical protein QAD02_005859 [Eretmocerus hayati]|uniref:Uncharacterized protein n=1 Tax=Eretmocerus hayati TaxID=131215 RepID=A0ACC2NU35_9HYME|nr:hypothetical protein QAD02_005859 [Eretmocerus hayati]
MRETYSILKQMKNTDFSEDRDAWYEYPSLRAFEDEMARIRSVIGVFFAEHALPYILIEDLYDLILNVSVHRDALERSRMKRTTFSKVVKNALAVAWKEELWNLLLTQKFTAGFDESTGVAMRKHGIIIIRTWHPRLRKIIWAIWAVVPIHNVDAENVDAGSETIFNIILEEFGNFEDIPAANLLEFVADGAASLMGVRNSVATRFARGFLQITLIICSNHAAALCARHAALSEPDAIHDEQIYLTRDIHSFLNTPTRKAILEREQARLNMAIKAIPRPFVMRWLTMGPATDILIENWEPVRVTLGIISQDVNHAVANRAAGLLARMDNPGTKAYQLFLNYILPTIENLNGWMQTNEVVIPEVYSKIKEAYLDVLDCLIDRYHLRMTPVEQIDPEDPNLYRNPLHIDVGEECVLELIRIGPVANELLVHFQNYLARLATEMCVRLERYWRNHAILECLLPTNAISADYHAQNEGIIRQVMERFPRALHGINAELVEQEWELLVERHPDFIPGMKTDTFWSRVLTFPNQDEAQNENPNEEQNDNIDPAIDEAFDEDQAMAEDRGQDMEVDGDQVIDHDEAMEQDGGEQAMDQDGHLDQNQDPGVARDLQIEDQGRAEDGRGDQNPDEVQNRDQPITPNLGQFAMNLLCLVHSNAESERGFSAERLIWTRLRIMLDISSTEANLLLRDCNRIHGFKGRAAHFQPTDRMIELVNILRHSNLAIFSDMMPSVNPQANRQGGVPPKFRNLDPV